MAGRWYRVESDGEKETLYLTGSWKLHDLKRIAESLEQLATSKGRGLVLDGRELEDIDTSAALLVSRFLTKAGVDTRTLDLSNFSHEHENILKLIGESAVTPDKPWSYRTPSVLQIVGSAAVDCGRKISGLVAFIGQVATEFTGLALAPRKFRIKELVAQLEVVCLRAIPIVCLVTFLIGVVVAYLFGIQLERYGANIFIVDGVARALARELSPMIVAIIVAGRSGASFTAQIGTMKVTEEIDAITTLGLSPIQVLVIPRILALVIALPFLVFIGDIAGLSGAMVAAEWQLEITRATFIDRLQDVLPLRTFLIGLVKAPVFAVFIAIIGCRMGLNVHRDARSIGLSTTSTVVQSIVSVILLDAAFAVLFVEVGV